MNDSDAQSTAASSVSRGLAPATGSRRSAVRLLQGYLWHPVSAGEDSAEYFGDFEDFDLENYLPRELGEAHVLWDKISPPFAFFENGEPTVSQVFYQLTVLQMYDMHPNSEQLNKDAQEASQALGPLLEVTPAGVGWQLWEDLREL